MEASGIAKYLEPALAWLKTNLLTLGSLYQLGVLALSLLVARWLAGGIGRHFSAPLMARFASFTFLGRLVRSLDRIWWPTLFTLLALLAREAGARLSGNVQLLHMAVSLGTAGIVIRFVAGFIDNRLLRRAVTWLALILAILSVADLLEPVLSILDSLGLTLGNSYISVLTLMKGLLLFGLLLRGVMFLSNTATRSLARAEGISPSLQALFSKLLRIGLYTLAFLVAVSAVGVDLTSLAVLSGALGVGIGFGLREIFANLISGILLLLDRAVKPGDVIELESGERGEVTAINIRYSVVRTRDGKEHILPNESLVVNPVVLWTHADRAVRLKLPVGVHYDGDPRQAMQLMEQAADTVKRVLKEPKPLARMRGFGDSSVDLDLCIWIEDSEKGVVNVESEVYLAIWDLFKEHGIQIPYPQRDLHIKEMPDHLDLEAGDRVGVELAERQTLSSGRTEDED